MGGALGILGGTGGGYWAYWEGLSLSFCFVLFCFGGGEVTTAPPCCPHCPHRDTSSSDDDSGSDFEATLQEKRGARGGPSTRLRPVPKHPRREPSEDGSSSEENVLYQAVMDGRVAIEVAVDEWLQGYKRDREPAFLELVNFIVRSCGCRGTVTLAMLREQQNTEIIQRLTETFSEHFVPCVPDTLVLCTVAVLSPL
ncbi:cohesin subunit SA-3-like [Anas platyrhynchos]|uniref:cohesin subunit SA-3-like n=1 Tax=Anas platyrhynchos TaxID=8839 RepID=UPI003AF2181B